MSRREPPHVTVLGAGMAGIAAASRARELGSDVIVLERGAAAGGHARSHVLDGFTFDEGPHVSFTRRPEIKTLLAGAVAGAFEEQDAVVDNLWYGHRALHPVQTHLFGFPPDLVGRCIRDLRDAHATPPTPASDYADWLLQAFGRTFAEEFPFRYTRKYWTTDPRQLTTEWLGDRIYRPALEEVLKGAERPVRGPHHYITDFRYPTRGGFGAYAAGLSRDLPVAFGSDVDRVDLATRTVELADGRTRHFDRLISSLPLPELVARIPVAPARVREAAGRLVATSIELVNVGIRARADLPEAHWTYCYDDDVLFSRLHYPHRLAASNAPPGAASLQAEVYHSRHRPLPCSDVLTRTIEDLRRLGILRADDQVLHASRLTIPYGNVMFDHDRAPAVAAIRAYLAEEGIETCGRYGEWAYYWTDDSIISGWRAAEAAARRSTSG